MMQRLRLTTALAVLLLPGCASLMPERWVDHGSLSWMDYENMDVRSRKARTGSLRRKISDCSGKRHCADLHYQLAMAYLSRSAPSRKALGTAELHLKKAAQAERYQERALLLHKVLRGWIHEADRHAKSKRRAKKLKVILEQAETHLERAETRLKRAKAVDLGTFRMISEE